MNNTPELSFTESDQLSRRAWLERVSTLALAASLSPGLIAAQLRAELKRTR